MLEKTESEYVTVEALAERLGCSLSSVHRGLWKWRERTGQRPVRKARAGGTKIRVLLTPAEGDEFAQWRSDYPQIEPQNSHAELARLVGNIARTCDAIAALLLNGSTEH